MKKTLGLVITAIGILIVVGAFTLTPPHALNPGDSNSGINASAGFAYAGFITFGIGIVLYISSLPFAGERTK
jgi:drug/metabolite transporter (DMT)-like permease